MRCRQDPYSTLIRGCRLDRSLAGAIMGADRALIGLTPFLLGTTYSVLRICIKNIPKRQTYTHTAYNYVKSQHVKETSSNTPVDPFCFSTCKNGNVMNTKGSDNGEESEAKLEKISRPVSTAVPPLENIKLCMLKKPEERKHCWLYLKE